MASPYLRNIQLLTLVFAGAVHITLTEFFLVSSNSIIVLIQFSLYIPSEWRTSIKLPTFWGSTSSLKELSFRSAVNKNLMNGWLPVIDTVNSESNEIIFSYIYQMAFVFKGDKVFFFKKKVFTAFSKIQRKWIYQKITKRYSMMSIRDEVTRMQTSIDEDLNTSINWE